MKNCVKTEYLKRLKNIQKLLFNIKVNHNDINLTKHMNVKLKRV